LKDRYQPLFGSETVTDIKVTLPQDEREMTRFSKLVVTGKFRHLNLKKIQCKTELKKLEKISIPLKFTLIE
jgi:hypothetical protein